MRYAGISDAERAFSAGVRQDAVFMCIEKDFVDGKLLLTDSTHIKANTRNDVFEQVTINIEPLQYLNRLNEQAKIDGIYPKNDENKALKPTTAGKAEEKVIKKSVSDSDAGFMKRPGKPLGFYYFSYETCVKPCGDTLMSCKK